MLAITFLSHKFFSQRLLRDASRSFLSILFSSVFCQPHALFSRDPAGSVICVDVVEKKELDHDHAQGSFRRLRPC